jgi:beta-lactam-binding protein with PASTA domain
MTEAMSGKPDVQFKEPPPSMLEGKQVQVPNLEGVGYADAKLMLEKLGFTVLRRETFSDAPRGQFLGWSPGSGSSVPEFSEIYAVFSGGRDPAQVDAERRAAEAQAKAEAEARAKAQADAQKQQQEQQKRKGKGHKGR